MSTFTCIADDVRLGEGVKLAKFINLYGCTVGDGTKIGAFVEIQKNATVGKNCKISSHSFVCEGVEIEDNVFIGHGVMFINDRYPRATNTDGSMQTEESDGLRAVCHQHEIDQLDGLFWINRLSRLKRERLIKRFEKLSRRP